MDNITLLSMQILVIEFFLLFVLIALNGLLAMAELAIVSSRKGRLESLAEKGDARAAIAIELVERPENVFSTVQLGITLIGIVAGALGGATFADYVAALILTIPQTASFAYPLAYTLVVLVITVLSLVFGELIPKRIALSHPEKLALIFAKPLRTLAFILTPFIRLLNYISNSVLSLAGGLNKSRPGVTEDELINMIDEGIAAGVVEHGERPILERVLTLGDRRLDSMMTHRRDIAWLDLDKTFQENADIIHQTRHTWYPVCDGSVDNVKGILCAKDLWAMAAPLSAVSNLISENMKPAFFLPGSTMMLQAIEQFKTTQNHVALIVDEHGSFEGLVTHHDLSSVVLGTLPSRGEQHEEDPIVQREDGSWLVSGSLSVHDFFEHFGVSLTDESEEHAFQTVAGFVITHLEKIPRVADNFDWNDFKFEVVDMDGNRVDKILVSKNVAPIAEPVAD